MVCTYCHAKTEVTNSRHQKRSNSVWRRRKCTSCLALFSTSEHVDYEKTWVVKYTGTHLQPFLRDKLFVSIFKSIQHRPQALEDTLGLTATVISALHRQNKGSATLPVHQIATETLQTLRRFDTAAATHYQAFHADVL